MELVDQMYYHLENGDISLAIFLDLSKAFDMLNHTILLEKLNRYGIKNKELLWFQNYLSERY